MSRYEKAARPALMKHRHCLICSTPIPMDKEFCGPRCEQEHRRLAKRRRYTFILMIMLFPIVFLLLTVLGSILGR